MHTADEIKAHAATRILRGIDFKDRTGSTAPTIRKCKVVILRFHDGTTLRTTPIVMRSICDHPFRLPTDDLSDEGKALLAELEAMEDPT